MICPKCGFEQPDGPECLRCGIVLAKYHGSDIQPPPPPPPLPPEPFPEVAVQGTLFPPVPEGVPDPHPSDSPLPSSSPAPPPPVPLPPPATPWRAPVALRPFESGALIGETFRVYFANFLPFVLLTTVAFLPLFFFAISPPPPGLLRTLVDYGGWLCTPIATAAVTYGVFQHMRRREASFSDCLRVGLSCLFPVLFVAILQALATGAGMLLCVVPGIIVAMMLAVAVPVAVEERPGVFAALRRSSELTDGYRGQVFGVLFILGLLNIGLGLLVLLSFGGLSEARALAEGSSPAFQLTSQVVNLVPTGLSATASAVMYYRLRSVKESIDVEEIASVFD